MQKKKRKRGGKGSEDDEKKKRVVKVTRLDPNSRCAHCARVGGKTFHCGTNRASEGCLRFPRGGVAAAPRPDQHARVRRCTSCRAEGLTDGLCGTRLASATCHVVHGKPIARAVKDVRCKACYFANGNKRKCSTKEAPTYCLFVPGYLDSLGDAATAGGGGGDGGGGGGGGGGGAAAATVVNAGGSASGGGAS